MWTGEELPAAVFYSVATGPYADHCVRLLRSADQHHALGSPIHWVVFSDDPSSLVRRTGELQSVVLDARRIDRQGWPSDTLRRYELIAEAVSEVNEDSLCAYMDADMVFVDEVSMPALQWPWPSGIGLVRHPGYFRLSRDARETLLRPRRLLYDSRRVIMEGGKWPGGEWETRPISQAFVPRRERKVYVCGGVWFGEAGSFSEMVSILAERVMLDQRQGVTARWHDESHLNWFASHKRVSILGPEFCWDASIEPPSGLEPKILAVDKGDSWVRE